MSTGFAYGYGVLQAESGVPAEVADGADVQLWIDTFGQQQIRGYNLGVGALDIQEVAPWGVMTFYNIFTQLTAVGNTASVNVEDYHHLMFQIVVANIDTSVDVIIQGSLDNSNFYNMDDAGVATQFTTNGTYQMHVDNRKNNYVRARLDAEAGGANVTLDIDLLAGN